MPDRKEKGGALARAELRKRLATLSGRARLSTLIDSPEAKRMVRSLPAEDLYYAIAEVGLADSTEIVQLASPTQFRTFVDLGGWNKDRIDPHQALTWLRAARGDEPEEFLAKVHAIDLELLEFILREFTVMHDREEDPDVNPEGVTVETPEGKYLIEIKVEGAELSAMRALINDLIGENPLQSVRMLEAVRWEMPSELEEIAHRFRSARIADLGFPELYDALSLFSFTDPSKLGPEPGALPPPGAELARTPERVDYLEAAAAALSDDERLGLEQELRYVSNAALVAEAAEPGELDAVRRVAELVRDYLSLGLEHLTGADPQRAAETVRQHTLSKIFQVGFSLTLKLKFRADRLAKEPAFQVGGALLLMPDEAAAVAALRRKRPLRALKVEGAEPVTFRSRRELADSEAILGRASQQLAIFRSLLGESAEAVTAAVSTFGVPLPPLGVDRLLAAVVCRAILDGSLFIGPVPSGRVVELCERLFEGTPTAPKLRPAAAQRAMDALSGRVEPPLREELRRMVDRTLARLLSELGAAYLKEGKLDPSAVVILPIEGQPAL